MATSSSASREAVERVIPVAVATAARETGPGEAKTRLASRARFEVRRLDWRAEGAPDEPLLSGVQRDFGDGAVFVLRATS